jgi:hypothetical protein
MENGECVWHEGAEYSYIQQGKRRTGRTQAGWHVLDGKYVKGGEHAPVRFTIDTLLRTSGGAVVQVLRPSYCLSREGAIKVDFTVEQGNDEMSEDSRGCLIYYDKALKHCSGNGISATSELDIIGVFTAKLSPRCPHCSHVLDNADINELTYSSD